MITFDVQLPALPDDPTNEIASGELTIVVDGGAPDVRAVARDATLVTGLSGPQDSTVELSFVYIDNAGNKSATPSTASVVLTDTVPPPNPGALGVVVTGEV